MVKAITGYMPLFKLRICSLITVSAVVGLIAAGAAGMTVTKALYLMASTMLMAMSASVFNHYFDKDIDTVMARTRKRPLPSGVAGRRHVLLISLGLFLFAMALSVRALNNMVALHLSLGAFVYAFIYTAWLKRRTSLNIIIGGLAGSFAVLAGGASARPDFCVPPLLLSVVMFFWTPSHFWSFAIYHREEYAAAGVPMLPVVIGDRKTSYCILANTVLLVSSSLLPYLLGYSGLIYLGGSVIAGAYFIYLNLRLVKNPTKGLAWKNFKASMTYLAVVFASVVIDSIFNQL